MCRGSLKENKFSACVTANQLMMCRLHERFQISSAFGYGHAAEKKNEQATAGISIGNGRAIVGQEAICLKLYPVYFLPSLLRGCSHFFA